MDIFGSIGLILIKVPWPIHVLDLPFQGKILVFNGPGNYYKVLAILRRVLAIRIWVLAITIWVLAITLGNNENRRSKQSQLNETRPSFLRSGIYIILQLLFFFFSEKQKRCHFEVSPLKHLLLSFEYYHVWATWIFTNFMGAQELVRLSCRCQ